MKRRPKKVLTETAAIPVGNRTGVYGIFNRRDGKVYVGSAAASFGSRWQAHLRMLVRGQHHSIHLQRAWDKWGARSFVFVVLGFYPPELCVVSEQRWMDRLKSYEGEYGYNRSPTAGSTLGTKLPESFREYCRKRGFPPGAREKSIQILRGRKVPRYIVERVAAKHRGMKRSEETRRNISLGQLGRKHSPATLKKLKAAARKRAADPAWRKKMSEVHTGRKLTEEHKLKITAGLRSAYKEGRR